MLDLDGINSRSSWIQMIDKSKDHYYLSYGIGFDFGLMAGALLAVMMGMLF